MPLASGRGRGGKGRAAASAAAPGDVRLNIAGWPEAKQSEALGYQHSAPNAATRCGAQIRMLLSFRATTAFCFFRPALSPPSAPGCFTNGPGHHDVARFVLATFYSTGQTEASVPGGKTWIPRIIGELSVTHVQKNAHAMRKM